MIYNSCILAFKNVEWSNRTNSYNEESKYETVVNVHLIIFRCQNKESWVMNKVNKVLQFFKLNDKVYEEFYFIGKESDCAILGTTYDNLFRW